MRPVIGITCSQAEERNQFYAGRDYARGVEEAGGIPLLLPPVKNEYIDGLVRVLNGVLLSGGGDIDPVFFGEEIYPETGAVDPERDEFELELTRRSLAGKKPVLGICRGMQVLNVALGGTVCQDISSKTGRPLKHMQESPRRSPSHGIEISSGTLAARILGTGKLRVNSFHHQSIATPAPGIIISGWAPDGVEEIIELSGKNHFVFGVQFHPENMWRRNPLFLEIFSHLVRQGKENLAENINYLDQEK